GYATVDLTAAGLTALKDGRPFMLTRPPAAARASAAATSATAVAKAGDIPCDEGLFAALRALRKQLADARDVPAYVVFSDVSLRHMARAYPADADTLRRIPGVGEKKLADFGVPILQAVAAWLADHPRLDFPDLLPAAAPVRRMQAEGALNGTAIATLERFRAGVSIEEIARERALTQTTIEGHLARAIADGEKLDPRSFYTAAEESAMQAAFVGHEGPALKPVWDQLDGRLSYGKLRIYQAFAERA
ncbi:MAG: hypothetical protein RLZZ522_289, partial [Verrucomicrobiota bacterium]